MQRFPVLLPVDGLSLHGEVVLPGNPLALIVFGNGSGNSLLNPRGRFVASELNDAGFATLVFDLLSKEEELFLKNRFEIAMLTARLSLVIDLIKRQPGIGSLAVGLFGTGTGAAAALRVASGGGIYAVVSKGGRPDLAGDDLRGVEAATLFIVGSHDPDVLQLNRRAMQKTSCPRELKVIEGAGHLFEEGNTLSEVCRHTVAWFEKHLPVAAETRTRGALST